MIRTLGLVKRMVSQAVQDGRRVLPRQAPGAAAGGGPGRGAGVPEEDENIEIV